MFVDFCLRPWRDAAALSSRWRQSISLAFNRAATAFSITLAVASLLAVGLFASATLVYAAPMSEVVADALKAVEKRIVLVEGYRANLSMMLIDKEFLADYFRKDNGLEVTSAKGLINCSQIANGAKVYLQYEGSDYHVFSINNAAVSYIGFRNILHLETAPNTFTAATFVPVPAPPEASPSPSPSASPNEATSFGLSTGRFEELSPNLVQYSIRNPLMFVAPYSLQTRNLRDSYRLVSKKASILGLNAVVVEVTHYGTPYKSKMWINPQNGDIVQVESFNSATNNKITATYLSFYNPDRETHYDLYSRVKVDFNDMPLYMAELSNPKFNVVKKLQEAAQAKAAEKEKRSFIPTMSDIADKVVPILSGRTFQFVIFLCFVLVILAGRFIWFRISRQEFSDELIVVDEEDGRFSEMLDKMGYHTVPFTAEAVAVERDFLGKGATKDTSYRPRAIIIAPDSFELVRNYSFLLRAYVEEGGRLLVMYHPQKAVANMPFKPELLPSPKDNAGLAFEFREETITSVKEDSVKRICQLHSGAETILSVDGHKVNTPLVWAINKSTDIRSTVVGTYRIGKGEYIACQLQFKPQATLSNQPMQFMLNDLFRYLLGLEPIIDETM